MYQAVKVNIPTTRGISRKKINGTTYIYYELSRTYLPEKKYNCPKCVTIGKMDIDDPTKMFPNEKFRQYFPEEALPEEEGNFRSSCIHAGAYYVIRKVIQDCGLDEKLGKILGRDAGLFLDFAAYAIMTEDNAAQYYPDYAYNHLLFTEEMRIFSDSTIGEFLQRTTRDQRIEFLNEWNTGRDHRERIYISYDSTNKNCQAGDIDMVEVGHPKEDNGKPIFNVSVAYDGSNREPLFYESYPGSIVDVSQLQYMLGKAQGYGYRHVGFILDRGYFGRENIRYMDKCGYEFVIMTKGMKALVSKVVEDVRRTFEKDRRCSIRSYRVNGTTVSGELFPSDERKRYFHVYYSERKAAAEREEFEQKIDRMAAILKEKEGEKAEFDPVFERYFDLIYYHKGEEDEAFVAARERTDEINKVIAQCGYFVFITSEKMTAAEALHLYKSRDASEKLFRGNKSYLGGRTERTYSNESTDTKLFIEFVAMIIRNRIYTSLKDEMESQGKRMNYMTVPAALKELDKIEILKRPDGAYTLDHAITTTQKAILRAFGMDAVGLQKQIRETGKELAKIVRKEASAGAAEEEKGCQGRRR